MKDYLKKIINDIFIKIRSYLINLKYIIEKKYLMLKYEPKKFVYFVSSLIAIIIIILGITTIYNLKYKNFVKYKFYYIDYYGKLKYEKFNVPNNYSINDLINIYFSGPYNKKKFPDYIFNIKYYDRFEIKENIFYITLNVEGLKKVEEINEDILKLCGYAIKKTFSIHKIKIDNIIFLSYFTNLKVLEINLNKK